MNPAMGGPCQGIRNLVPALESLGCENHVVCLDDPSEPYVTQETFPIHALGASRGRWARNPALPKWLKQHLPDFDAVIIHGLWQYPAVAASRAVETLRKQNSKSPKLFVMPHGMLDPWFQKDPSRRLKALRNTVYWKLVEQRTIAIADGILFTTQNELELAREPFRPYRPKKEWNAGYGVAEPPPRTSQMKAAFQNVCPQVNARPYLLYLSRIHPKKGVDLLLEEFSRVIEERALLNDTSPALVVAGPIDSDFARKIKKMAEQRMQVANRHDSEPGLRIHFPGMLTGDAKWGAFYGCEAFVLPSHQENFGIAVVEAMACAKPVLISDQVNICNEIKAKNAGWICRDDAASLGDTLTELLNQPRSSLNIAGINARTAYESYYKPENAAKRLLDILSN